MYLKIDSLKVMVSTGRNEGLEFKVAATLICPVCNSETKVEPGPSSFGLFRRARNVVAEMMEYINSIRLCSECGVGGQILSNKSRNEGKSKLLEILSDENIENAVGKLKESKTVEL